MTTPRTPGMSTNYQSLAVEVSNVNYTYPANFLDWTALLADPFGKLNSFFTSSSPVLKNVSITVPKAAIYALLGPSGCGKTTLLKSILGRICPNSGCIRIFGKTPGIEDANCNVPGAGVGFMPQDLALLPELSINETLTYFGQLYRMSREEIKVQIETIINLLSLPAGNRIIKQLSGGQQRRVSLACALIHRPPLMILDEPTVGVDPLLRATIWSYLETLCEQAGTTVIITTHYIEEARAAQTIGLMRDGRLLVQANPEVLLLQHNLPRLEDVFLKLCEEEDQGKKEKSPEGPGEAREMPECLETFSNEDIMVLQNLDDILHKAEQLQQPEFPPSTPTPKASSDFDLYRFRALFTKNCIRLVRNFSITLLYCFLPALQFAIFVFCTGSPLDNLPLAIVNDEVPPQLTGRFLSHLDPAFIIQKRRDTIEEAEQLVRDGKAWAVLHFMANFSEALDQRRIELASATDETIYASNLHVYLDMSNPVVGVSVAQNVLQSFLKLIHEYLASHGYNRDTLSPPMVIKEVVYGNMGANLADGTMDLHVIAEFATPAVILLIAFFTTAAVTGLSLILERKDGLFERSLVAGVRPVECLIAQLLTQGMILVIQQVLLFGTIFYLFGVQSKGPLIWVFVICFLQGIAGIMYGLFIASVCADEVSATIVASGSFLPTIMVSGIFWPIQALWPFVYWIVIFLPQTLAMESLRSLIARGWSIDNPEVFLGFGATGAWILIFLLLAVFVLSRI